MVFLRFPAGHGELLSPQRRGHVSTFSSPPEVFPSEGRITSCHGHGLFYNCPGSIGPNQFRLSVIGARPRPFLALLPAPFSVAQGNGSWLHPYEASASARTICRTWHMPFAGPKI